MRGRNGRRSPGPGLTDRLGCALRADSSNIVGARLRVRVVRADHAWAARSEAHTTEAPPWALLRRTCVDSLVYTPEQLRHLVSVMRESQVTLGSDHAFDMGVDEPVERLKAAGFDAATTDVTRGSNAAHLLGLDT